METESIQRYSGEIRDSGLELVYVGKVELDAADELLTRLRAENEALRQTCDELDKQLTEVRQFYSTERVNHDSTRKLWQRDRTQRGIDEADKRAQEFLNRAVKAEQLAVVCTCREECLDCDALGAEHRDDDYPGFHWTGQPEECPMHAGEAWRARAEAAEQERDALSAKAALAEDALYRIANAHMYVDEMRDDAEATLAALRALDAEKTSDE